MSSLMRFTALPRAHARRTIGGAAGVVLAAALVLAACEGDNLFSGTPRLAQGAPVVTAIQAPASVAEGTRLDIRVRAIAPRGLTKIEIRYRRAVVTETVFEFAARTDSVIVDTFIDVPQETADSIIVIDVVAGDQSGRLSEVATATVRVIDASAPAVSVSLTPTTASAGDTVLIRVSARDALGLQSVGYALVTTAGDTLFGGPSLFPASGAARDTVFRVALPESIPVSTVRVLGLAVNTSQLRGVSSPLALNVVDLSGPQVTILQPNNGESYPLSDSILVRVHVADSGGIREVRMKGIAIVRDSLQNTSIVTRYVEKIVPFPQQPDLAPRDTVLQRFLLPAPGTIVGPVLIIVTARDFAGNERADTISVIDGPRVQITNPATGTGVAMNSMLLVRITAADPTAGLDSLKLVIGGVRQEEIVLRNLRGVASLDTTLAIQTGSVVGILTLQPLVWNVNGIRGPGQLVTLLVGTTQTADTQRPLVSRTVQAPPRVELDDSIRVTVRATDGAGSGVKRVGIVVEAVSDDPGLGARLIARTTAEFSPPLSGTPERDFFFTLGEKFTELETTYPRNFALRIHAFAVDAAENCGASVGTTLTGLECEPLTVDGQSVFTARGATPALTQVVAVLGSSVQLPAGGRIADAVVDVPRQRIYLSNVQNNRIESFDLATRTFEATGSATRKGLVGAAPWGMVINNTGDTLYVANSGGTNISALRLSTPTDANDLVEDVGRRLLTPNTVLIDVTDELTETGRRYTRAVYDFSDRPQFIAQHASGILLYSTWPTSAARPGTLRFVTNNATGVPAVHLMHRGQVTDAENVTAIAGVDSVVIVRGVNSDSVVIYDRHPDTNMLLVSAQLPLREAILDIDGKGSDIDFFAGAWNVPVVSLNDTTFVTASGDRSTIAFGEGAIGPFGRVFLCCTISTGPPLRIGLVNEVSVQDLVNNAAERVGGLGLNANGSLGIARGTNSVYYFSNDLRLQGEFRTGMAGGAGGAALHPGHAQVLQEGDDALSFAATANRSIKIIDALHFYERGEIQLRDNVVGPLRAVLPAAGANGSLAASHPDFIVVQLIAVTAGDNVVVVNVRRRDVQR